MYLRTYKMPGKGEIVAACDRELLNRTLTFGDIEFFVDEKFYGNTPATEEELITALKEAENANLVGIKVVSVAIRCGAAEQESCLMIGEIPHIQIL